MASGKLRHFAFVLGLGYGYLQYKFFDDLLVSRAKMFDNSTQAMSGILSEGTVIKKIKPKERTKYEEFGKLCWNLYIQKAMAKCLNLVGRVFENAAEH